MNRRLGIILGVGSLLILGLLLLFGPGTQKDKPDAIFWKKDFDAIEYVSAGKDRATSLRLVRKAGLIRDEFTVEGSGKAARRGNYNAKNIFTDFSKPRNAGQYKLTPERVEELGFTAESPQVILYEKIGSAPLRLTVGKKNQTGNTFVRCDDPSFKDQVLLMPSYLFERFDKPIKEFREQRFLVYSTDSFTEELEVTIDGGGPIKSYWMKQEKYKKDGIELPRWRDRQGTEIPLNQASALENAVREIQILEYRDADGLPSAEDAWKRAGKDTTVVKVKVKGQDETIIRLRSSYVIQNGKDSLITVQSTVEPGTDFVRANVEHDLASKIDQIVESLQKKAEVEKRNHEQKDQPNASPAVEPTR
jgi:hypothetical protein